MENKEKNINVLSNFSQNMKSERMKKKISQKELAELVGISRLTILNYENNKTIPQPDIMNSIALALDTSLEKLIGNNNKEEPTKPEINTTVEKTESTILSEKDNNIELLNQSILDKVKFMKRIEKDEITNDELDEIIGGKSNFSKNKKIKLALLFYEEEIEKRFDSLEKFYLINED